jgi:hypothetical protein
MVVQKVELKVGKLVDLTVLLKVDQLVVKLVALMVES